MQSKAVLNRTMGLAYPILPEESEEMLKKISLRINGYEIKILITLVSAHL